MKLYYDFHLHSCLSPCASEDMTPANLAAMCALAGLNVVALTDHNTAGNCAAFQAACARHGLLALPGMELTTAEEVHVLCLLPDLGAAAAFQSEAWRRQPFIENNSGIFGRQLYMDDMDGILGEEARLLLTATGIGADEVAALAARFGGVAWPAHVNRASFSLFSSLGMWDDALGFRLAEWDRRCSGPSPGQLPGLAGVPLLFGSDAHELDQIADASQVLEVPEATPGAVLDWLRRLGGQPL